MDRTMRINLVGPGKVGQTLLRRMVDAGPCPPQDIFARREAAAEAARDFAGAGRAVSDLAAMRPADVWILTVPDGQISAVAEDLARLDLSPAIAVHCSGFHPSSILAPLSDRGWQVASAHPVLSFADPASATAQFPGCHCGVEGPASAPVAALFETLGARVFSIRTEAKALYHAAAVISNNFTTVLQALAQEAWAEAGVPEEVQADLQAVLLRGTVDNLLSRSPQAALTGPAARGDRAVVTAQAAAVAAWKPEAGTLYRVMSEMAVRLKTSGRT